MRAALAFLGLSSLLLGLGGCASLQNLVAQPKVELQSVGFQNITPTDATALFNLQITNPNPFGIHVSNVTYDLSMNGRDLITGVLDQGFQLAAGSVSTVQVPVKVEYVQAFDSVSQMLSRGASDYDLRGSVATSLVTVPYELKGSVSLPDWRTIAR